MDTDGERWAKQKDDKHLPTSAHGVMAPLCNTEAKNGSNSGARWKEYRMAAWLAAWMGGWLCG